MKKKLSKIFAISLIFVCASCATGPTVSEKPRVAIPPGKALVYIYRPVCGSPFRLDTESIQVNGQYIGNLKSSGAISYIAAPGKVDVSGKKGPSLNWGLLNLADKFETLSVINAEPGKTYYLRFKFVPRAFVPLHTIEWVRDEVGASDIAKCKLQN